MEGSPRSWRRLRGLDEVLDADPAEAWLWASGRTPDTPRVPRRERRGRGGAVAVLRDVSASMEGRLGAWAGDVVCALAALGRRRRMKLGYLEFNHAAQRFSYAHRFFHGRYDAIAALGARRRCEGRTSYQAPLAVALDELSRTPERERHVVLLTDGVPVVGDPEVRSELAAARRLGDDAGNFIENCRNEEFDFIFLDSDREQYVDWWASLQKILKPNGLIVVDNAISHKEEVKSFTVEKNTINFSDNYWKTLFVEIILNKHLVKINHTLTKQLTQFTKYEFLPHVSLLYKNMEKNQKQFLAESLDIKKNFRIVGIGIQQFSENIEEWKLVHEYQFNEIF